MDKLKIDWKNLVFTTLRTAIGWHFLYEGLNKLLTPGWTSEGYLKSSFGFLSGFFHFLASWPEILKVVDFLNIWGLILIGTGLFLGILIRVSAVSGIFLLVIYYLAYPPFGLSSLAVSQEGHFWIVNRNLIECFALGVICFFPGMDYSILNFFKRYREWDKDKTVYPGVAEKRRALLKGLISLPLFGGVVYSAARAASVDDVDGGTGATMKIKTFNLSDLKGNLPKGKLGNLEVSRMIMGCNLIGGWAHSRDLIYCPSLFKHYNTEGKIFETWGLGEQSGINTVNLSVEMYPFFNKYKKISGSKLQSIAQILIVPGGPDRLINFKRAVDQGATSIYIQGNSGDELVRAERFDLIREALEYIRSQGLVAGIGGHDILTCMGCDRGGIRPDYYMKTLHHERYWSASPVEYRKDFGVITPGRDRLDHNSLHDNMWDLFPEKTVEFFATCDVPWIGFKVMAAGAIKPRDGFKYAFEKGADFICVGMFDFQVIEDVNIVNEILGNDINRERPWYA